MPSSRPFLAWLVLASCASAADLIVTVSGIPDTRGDVRCAVFRSADGFPMQAARATLLRQPAQTANLEFRFEGLAPGRYAVAVAHDRNVNGKTDTNFVGIPTEPWGVSNNVRPRMRAPKFEEAIFEVKDGQPNRIEIQVAK